MRMVDEEFRQFFCIASELRHARRNRAPYAVVRALLEELESIAINTSNETLRRRCDFMLLNNRAILFRRQG